MRFNEGIQVEEVETCLLCRAQGVPRYGELRDRLFGAAGIWSILSCPNCGLSWLSPRPAPSDIGKAYQTYYTHNLADDRRSLLASLKSKVEQTLLKAGFGYDNLPGGTGTRLAGRLLGALLPMATEIAGSSVMWLDAKPQGKLLDVGCGNASFLARMQKLGWDVVGVEPDAKSARVAREQLRMPVAVGTLGVGKFSDDSFDAITAHHVIEHMHDPVEFLRESWRILKPGGGLVVTTPNIESFGHRLFRGSWRGLEVPRHLYLFSLPSLGTCIRQLGYRIEMQRTSARSAWEIWYTSRLLRRDGGIPNYFPRPLNQRLRLEGLVFQLLQHLLLCWNRNIGEQIVLMASKPAPQLRCTAPPSPRSAFARMGKSWVFPQDPLARTRLPA